MPNPAVFGPLTLTVANHADGVSVTATNQQALGVVKVLKTSPNGTPLSGAVFQLWQETNGTDGLQTSGASMDTEIGSPCTTDDSGTCASVPLPLGTYYWQETAAPAGYVLPSPGVFGPLVLTMANYTAGISTNAVDAQVRKPVFGTLNVLKTDLAGKPLPGAVFVLWRETNSAAGLQTGGPTPDTQVGNPCTTGADGTCKFGGLLAGSYYVQETSAPAGYSLPAPPVVPLTVTEDQLTANPMVAMTVKDTAVTPDIVINKKDGPTGKEAQTTGAAIGYTAGETRTISIPVTNNGPEPLVNILITDTTIAGDPNVKIRGFSCAFPDGTTGTAAPQPNGSQAVSWAATAAKPPKSTFAIGATFLCSATLTMPAGSPMHGDTVTVTGDGAYSGKPVTSKDTYYGKVPPMKELPHTGTGDVAFLGEIGGVSLLVGAGFFAATAWGRKRRGQKA
jgi:protocatechuate 3,4-dioxygenase beta subunit